MSLSKTIYKKEIVFTVKCTDINDEITESIINGTKSGKKIGINMKHVNCINSRKFIQSLLDGHFRLFNLRNEVLVYLAIILKDGFLKSHMSLEDLYFNKRELIKRHFLVA